MAASSRRAERPPPLWAYVLTLAVVVSVIYVPDVGRGFIKDDFGWILASRIESVRDLPRLFANTTGFYRPLVSLTFAANEWLFGINPLGYGLTNLALLVACAASVGWLARAHNFGAAASLFAGAIWILNFHGINMAVLWISGRTALLLTLFGVLAAVAARSGQVAPSAFLALCAMLSKEEAVLLPIPLLLIVWIRGSPRGLLVRGGAYYATAEAVYFALRVRSDAMTPANAPDVYRFIFAIDAVFKNIIEYADRSSTLVAAVMLLLLLLARRLPVLSRNEKHVAAIGLAWLLCGFALTVFLPVRSSLYACFPSVGTALIGAVVCSALWRTLPETRQRHTAIAALLLPILLIPVYKNRNRRWVELADFTTRVTPALRRAADTAKDDRILIVDDPSTRVNMASAFGSISEATAVLTTERRTVWLVGAPWEPHETVTPALFRSAWVLCDVRLVEEDAKPWAGSHAHVME